LASEFAMFFARDACMVLEENRYGLSPEICAWFCK
jgi:hypothetical protein